MFGSAIFWAALAILVLAPGHAQPAHTIDGAPSENHWDDFAQSESDAAAVALEAYFGHPFVRPVTATVLPDRATFDAAMPAEWGIAPSQCWMVGIGAADRLLLLSPAAWAGEACDHKAEDADEARSILRHEMAHVYHGQHNPTGDFTGMDEAGWFVEGLAVLTSGQLDDRRMAQARAEVTDGKGPTALADAWSGPARYGVGGSLVRFIEATWGWAMLFDLLGETSNAAILERLGVTEQTFLQQWRAWMLA